MARGWVWFLVFGLLGIAACGRSEEAGEPALSGASAPPLGPDSFILETPGGERQEVRLAAIRGPREEPARSQARAALEALLARGAVEADPEGRAPDRYGRRIAQVYDGEGAGRVWIQAALVEAGWAMTATYPETAEAAQALLALEAEARAAGRGAWGSGAFQIRDTDPDRLAQVLDSFQIIEGRVIDAAQIRSGRVYINFGLNWRTDFTVKIEAGDLDRFEAAGLDPLSLPGARVRVRGWLYEENGPMIRLDHPEPLERIEAPEAARAPGP